MNWKKVYPYAPEVPLKRFIKKLSFKGGCFLYKPVNKDGYGIFSFRMGELEKKRVIEWAHRVAYKWKNNKMPLCTDHLCRNKACVNPDHLESTTSAENIRREFRRRTHCRNGHPFSKDNTAYWGAKKRRKCRTCSNNGLIRFRRKLKEQSGDVKNEK